MQCCRASDIGNMSRFAGSTGSWAAFDEGRQMCCDGGGERDSAVLSMGCGMCIRDFRVEGVLHLHRLDRHCQPLNRNVVPISAAVEGVGRQKEGCSEGKRCQLSPRRTFRAGDQQIQKSDSGRLFANRLPAFLPNRGASLPTNTTKLNLTPYSSSSPTYRTRRLSCGLELLRTVRLVL